MHAVFANDVLILLLGRRQLSRASSQCRYPIQRLCVKEPEKEVAASL